MACYDAARLAVWGHKPGSEHSSIRVLTPNAISAMTKLPDGGES